jgi:single-strand DNA-binding protein
MASYNRITLVGNVGKDPELKTVGNNKVIDFSLAINEPARGQMPEKTEWYRVSFWDRKAETIAQYVKRGTQIMVEGRLSVRTYLDNSQRERYSLEVSGTDFVLLGSRPAGDEQGDQSSFQRKPAVAAPNQVPSTPVSSPVMKNGSAEEDDLPF